MSLPGLPIVRAVTGTANYYRRTAIYCGVVALVAVLGALRLEQTAPKGGALAVGVVFAVFCYRTLRTSHRFLDPDASPVLAAITRDPARIARVSVEQGEGMPTFVVVEDRDGARLALRIAGADAQQLASLLDAFGRHAPNADVARIP